MSGEVFRVTPRWSVRSEEETSAALIAGLPDKSAIVGVSPGGLSFRESRFGSVVTVAAGHPELLTMRLPTELPLAVLVVTEPPSVIHSWAPLLAMMVFSRIKIG